MQILLSLACVALTSAVVGNAYYQKKQFYPAVVYITKSNASMAVIYIQFFVIVFMFGKLLRKIFLGTLRAAEFEHLLERFWYALTETCLAFTVFRDDFNPRFVALFTVLLFLKSFHWLAEERVDFMERSPVLGWIFHIRVASLLFVLGILDYMLFMHAYNSTLERGPTVQLVFGFEYGILLTVVASTAIKYVLHAAEMRTDTPWENKAVFLLYTELVIGLIKVVLYVLFVIIMAKIYALPMFVFRPMFFTIRNFKKALSDVIMSRRAIRNMNTLYPDATPEELRLSDNICIICREDMINHSKKLPCGHIFHTTCLRSWFQRQQTCPTCRLNILRTPTTNVNLGQRGAAANAAAARQEDGAAAAAPGVQQQPPINVGINGGIPTPNVAAGGAMPNVNVPGTTTNLPGTTTNENAIPTATATGIDANTFSAYAMPNFLNIPPLAPPFAAGIMPPFMMPPPFNYMTTPFNVPPPPMPNDLTTFTDEELRAMEGTERKKVEERLKLLRNINLMLDSASVLMRNYEIVAANSNVMQATPQSDELNSRSSSTPTPAPSMNTAAAEGSTSTTFSNLHGLVPTTAAAAAAATATTTTPTSTSKEKSDIMKVQNSNAGADQQRVVVEDLINDNSDDEKSQRTGLLKEAEKESNNIAAPSMSSTAESKTGISSELNELRERRLKYLEESQKQSSTTETAKSNTNNTSSTSAEGSTNKR